jgi:hypothetical protein
MLICRYNMIKIMFHCFFLFLKLMNGRQEDYKYIKNKRKLFQYWKVFFTAIE